MSVRVYGHFTGQNSLVSVAKGFAVGLPDAFRYDLVPSISANDLADEDEVGGADAEHAVFVGSLAGLEAVVTKGRHKYVWTMVTPNSTEIGEGIAQRVLAYSTHILTPSRWAMGVLRRLLPETSLHLVRHGIDAAYVRTGHERFPEPTFLHLSSSEQERKGTRELVEGWALAALPRAKLLISVPSASVYVTTELVEHLGIQDSVQVSARLNFEPSWMAQLYSRAHFVVQPSRGEGFGLVPLEARACGTPTIVTNCTGHADHSHPRVPGTLVVGTGLLEPIDDVPGALAPSLSVEEIARALRLAFDGRERLLAEAEENAPAIRRLWSWETQLAGFREMLRDFGREQL